MPRPGPVAPALPPRGSVAEEIAALNRVKRKYSDLETRAKTDDEAKATLVRSLLEDSKRETDLTTRVALLSWASDLSLELGAIDAGFALLELMHRLCLFDIAAERVARIDKLQKAKPIPEVAERALRTSEREFMGSVVETKYEVASQWCRVGGLLARSQNDTAADRRFREWQEAVRELATEQRAADQRRRILETMPDDPQANLLVGKFTCWGEGDWTRGLPLLAKGVDEELRRAALAELANPATPAEKLAVGENWLLFGRNRTGLARQNILAHAREWLVAAAKEGEGEVKTDAQKRIQAIDAIPPAIVAEPAGM